MMEPDGVGLDLRGRTHVLKATPGARSVPSIWLLGSSDYSARLAAEKGLPYVFAHHFSGRGTAEALELYRSEFRPSPELDAPRTFLTVNAAVAPTRRGGRAARPARSCCRWWRCAPEPRSPRSRWSRRRRRSSSPTATPDLVEAMRERWVIGDPDEAADALRTLAATYDVDEVMVNPVGGAYTGDRTRGVAGAGADAQVARRCSRGSISVSGTLRTKLLLRPNVGLFRGASRLPG